jgi:hypothetical protein
VRLKLKIEPITNSTWGLSLANKLPKEEWDKIRREVYYRAKYKCDICGASGWNCHEVWRYEDSRRIQRLIGVGNRCDKCHDLHHFGRSKAVKSKKYIEELISHWCSVNGKSRKDFFTHEKEVFEISKKRADRLYIVKVGNRIIV